MENRNSPLYAMSLIDSILYPLSFPCVYFCFNCIQVKQASRVTFDVLLVRQCLTGISLILHSASSFSVFESNIHDLPRFTDTVHILSQMYVDIN